MQTENGVFFFHDTAMQLFDTSSVSKMGILTPEKIDHEMHYRKSPSTLYIRGLSQAGLWMICRALWILMIFSE